MVDASVTREYPELESVPTGISGLDMVLRGGLVRGGVYLVGGRPGTGKTTLGNHIAHNHVIAGGTALFSTVLGETHDRMLRHLQGFKFLVPEQISERIHYFSIYDTLLESGLEGVLALIRQFVRERQASLLVIDGISTFKDFTESALTYRQFAYELHVQLAAMNCTALLLSDYDNPTDFFPIGNHVDGILVLDDESDGQRDVRVLHVIKMRGINYLRGRHEFAITDAGIEVYPRLETVSTRLAPDARMDPARLPLGVSGLDEMLRGGLFTGSTTMVIGAPGAGKTLTGLHFVVEGARKGEKGLIVGFHETSQQLINQAAGVGLELGKYVDEGLIKIVRHSSHEMLLDAWAYKMLAIVQEMQPKRLVIDAVTDLQLLSLHPSRLTPFLTALTDELRGRQVTTLFVSEVESLFGMDVGIPTHSPFGSVENTILLRYVEIDSYLRRLISVLKVRGSNHDTSIREFSITDGGIKVGDIFTSETTAIGSATRTDPTQLHTRNRSTPESAES